MIKCRIFAGDEAAPVVDVNKSRKVEMDSVIELQKSSQI